MYDIFSRYYDSLTDNAEYSRRGDYYNEIMKRYGIKGGILLDAGCGTGSMSIEMAKRGYEVIGIDPGVGMLMTAREKAEKEGVDILLLNQSMEELDLYGTVDCSISVLDCINHLESEDNMLEAFGKISLFTIPGGIFAFDVNTIYKHRNTLGNNSFVIENDEVYCVWQNFLNEDDSVDISLDFFEENEDGSYLRSSEYFTERAYPLEKISGMLRQSGFEVIDVFDDMTFEPVRDESDRAVFVARKVS